MHRLVRTAARAAIASLALGSACARTPHGDADLIVRHAKVWTGAIAGTGSPDAEALAIVGDRIVDAGSESMIDRWRGPSTVVVDAGGRRVVPGFDDAHVHLVDAGMRLDGVDLRDADSPAEFSRRIAERAKARPGEWITGGDWNPAAWPGGARPARALIDDATNGTPVFVTSAKGDAALANAAALGRAGITESTSNPAGGTIVRDDRGFPTGLLEGTAVDLVAQVVPAPTPERRVRAVQRATEQARALGVTSLQDVGSTYADVDAYADLEARGELTARIYAILPEAGWYDQAKLGLHRAFGSVWVRIGAIRWSDSTQSAADVRTRLQAADHAGLQLAFDIGSAPLREAVTFAAGLVQTNGERDRRLRIETTARLAAADREHFARLNVIASLHSAETAHAARSEQPIRQLLESRVRLALGSDWPTGPLNPFVGLSNAIAAGATAAEALDAYTRGGAIAEFQEAQKGTLVRGALADLVVLTDDVLAIPAERIKDIRVLATIVGGKVVYHRRP